MRVPFEVPDVSDLANMPIDVVPLDDLGAFTVTAWANDGAVVTVTWDEIAASVSVVWTESGRDLLMLSREAAVKLSIRHDGGLVEFHILSSTAGMTGQLLVSVGEHVSVSDSFLWT